jgi:hypothetical protein
MSDEKPHNVTRDRRLIVLNLTAFGCNLAYIASQLEISVPRLKELYANELTHGHEDAVRKVAQRIFNIATTGDAKEAIPAGIFWLKTRAGWSEPKKDSKDDKPLDFESRDELLDQLANKYNDDKS